MLLRRIIAVSLASLLSSTALAGPTEKATWVGNALWKTSKNDNHTDLWAIQVLIRHYKQNPGDTDVKGGVATAEFFRWQTSRLKNQLSPGFRPDLPADLELKLQVGEWVKSAGPAGAGVGTWYQDWLKSSFNDVKAGIESNKLSRKTSNFVYSKVESSKTILGEAYDLAEANPTFRDVLDQVYLTDFAAKTTDSSSDILERNPDFAASLATHRLLDDSGKIRTDINSLKEDVLKSIKAQSEKTSALVGDLGRSFSELEKELKSNRDETGQIVAAMIAQKRAEHAAQQQKIINDGLRSSINVVAFLINDKLAARKFSSVSHAVLDLQDSFNAFNANIIAMSGQGKFGEFMSSAVLAGNLLSIGLNVAAAFQDPGPNPDVLIMEQIGKLSEQIEEFRKETHERFDRIDNGLSAIYDQASQGFAALSQQISHVGASVESVRESLSLSLQRLDQIEARVIELLKLIADLPFNSAMTRCVDYKDRTGEEMTKSIFDDCIASIIQFVETSKAPALSGEWKAGSTFLDIDGLTRDRDWATPINALLGIADSRGGYNFAATGRRANPARWGLAAQKFLTIAGQNQDLFRQSPLTALDGLLSEGLAIDRDLSSGILGYNGNKFATLLASLASEYKDNVSRVDLEVRKVIQNTLKTQGVKYFQYSHKLPALYVESEWHSHLRTTDRPTPPLKDPSKRLPPAALPPPPYAGPPPVLLTADASFPNLANNRLLFAAAFDVPYVFWHEALNIAQLSFEYDFQWVFGRYTNIPDGQGGILWNVWANPRIDVHAFLEKQTRQSLGVSTLVSPHTYVAYDPFKTGWDVGRGLSDYDPRPELLGKAGVSAFPVALKFSLPATMADIDSRHDRLLEAIQVELANELNSPGSGVDIATRNLDAVVNVMRGLIALALPDTLSTSDAFRRVLFGVPGSKTCERFSARLEPRHRETFKTASAEERATKFCNMILDGEEYAVRSGTDEETLIDPDILVSRQSLTSSLSSAFVAGSVSASTISAQSLLLDLKERSNASTESLFELIEHATASPGYSESHDFLETNIGLLRLLRLTHSSSS